MYIYIYILNFRNISAIKLYNMFQYQQSDAWHNISKLVFNQVKLGCLPIIGFVIS